MVLEMISVFCKVICSGLDMHIIVQDKVSFLLETNHVTFCLYYFVPGTKMSYMLNVYSLIKINYAIEKQCTTDTNNV